MSYRISISKTSTIKDALVAINDNSKGAVVVVDKCNKLVRIITDGDIRRSLLDGADILETLGDTFESVVSVITGKDTNSQLALSIMDKHEIDHLVVVDSDSSVIDLLHRKEITPILLSSPHMGVDELKYVGEAFSTNWIAPLGPNVDGFENEIASYTGAKYAAALSSGTAAIHLSLVLLDIKPGDVVLCSTLTFIASVNPILYQHATPAFVDSEPNTWNMSPIALEKALSYYSSIGNLPKAIIVVNLYGQSADMDSIIKLSEFYNVPIIEDAAESLGASYKGKQSGTFGLFGIYSFNGNKIITTSGGGMLVSNDKALIEKARFLSTQARDPAPYYEHTQIGYNYRMSNVLAGIGRGQLGVLSDRVEARRAVYSRYVTELNDISCLDWMPEIEGYYSNRWLTALVLNPNKTSVDATQFIDFLKFYNIEARHVWKPMHLQPIFAGCNYFTHCDESVSEYLFNHGVCLPSGSSLTIAEQKRVINAIRKCLKTD